MEVKYDIEKDLLIYDRKLKDGAGDSMYGLEVCKSLSLPQDFLNLAYSIRLQTQRIQSRYNSKKVRGDCELCGGKGIDIHHLSYQKDSNSQGFIGHFSKNHVANLINICKDCHDNIHKLKLKYKKVKTDKGLKLLER